MGNKRLHFPNRSVVFHCISRITGGDHLLDELAKETLRNQLWRSAEFCGVEIITYVIMSNHLHILVRVPPIATEVTSSELLRRFSALYPRDQAAIQALRQCLDAGGDEAERRRAQLLARMHDVSAFMKTLKQRFSIWYNKNHKRFGTLWAEPFKSLLVEDSSEVLKVVAAYIDLNPLRAGLVEDPVNYRFCGYSEAMAGSSRAISGLASTLGNAYATGKAALAAYRAVLFGQAGKGANAISPEKVREIMENDGCIPVGELIRCRLRFLGRGVALGSAQFIKDVDHALHPGKRRRRVRDVPIESADIAILGGNGPLV